MADVSVRPARPDDVPEIARVQVETWRTCYPAILPAAVLDALSVELAHTAWQQALDAPPSRRHHILVAQEKTALVGFVALGPADDLEAEDPDPTTTIAISPLLVEPRWGRRGHGSRLLSAAVDTWREDSFGTAVAWAYDDDPATRRFLESAGWEPDGARRALDVDDLLVPQLRLHVNLESA
jgi:GNAT superfamily N-acetyltransferase